MTLSATTPAFETRGLTKRFGRRSVLKDVNLALQPGLRHVLFGRNGAGKSTFLGIAATLLKPTSGEIFYEGRELAELGDGIRSRIGMVSHHTFLYPDLSVLENLEFYRRLYGVDADLAEALAWAELDLRRHSAVRSLSRGMQQRLAIARALLHRPQLLLLDEPYTGLDTVSADKLSGRLKALAETTMLLTTHDVERGVAIADRILILESGRLAFDATGGSAEDVRRVLAEIREVARS